LNFRNINFVTYENLRHCRTSTTTNGHTDVRKFCLDRNLG
jgi:hypothetical protein